MSVKDPFGQSSDPTAFWRREGLPDPGRLAHVGIRTKESLDWLAARDLQPPAPAMHPDNPELEDQAREQALRDHRERINLLRAEFRGGSFKAREDFGMARDFGKRDQDRAR